MKDNYSIYSYAPERDLSQKVYDSILDVTNDPVHYVEKDGVNALYNEEKYSELASKVYLIMASYGLDNSSVPEKTKALIINSYIKSNVRIRRSYFDAFEERIPEIPEKEIPYRSAYSALVEGETMCAGYTEAFRILCQASGIKTRTLLSKLPGKNKKLLHYVILVTFSDGTSQIFDPEREMSCESKNYDFESYQNSMDFILPNNIFINDKVGKSGVGIDVNSFIKKACDRTNIKNNLFYFKEEDGHVDVYFLNNDEFYDPDNVSKMTPCSPLEDLIKREKFMKYIASGDCILVTHGKDSAYILELIASEIEKFKLKEKSEKGKQNGQDD